MATSSPHIKMNPPEITVSNNQTQESEEETLVQDEEIQQLMQTLPKTNYMGSNLQLTDYQGFWIGHLKPILTLQRHFQAQHTDLIICSLPKTGTTWLKSLLFSIVNRSFHPPKQSPLLTRNPHELVYNLEHGVYGNNPVCPLPGKLDELPEPRLLHTHLPCLSLPESIKASQCKIVYVARNPLDTIVSYWHFYPNIIRNAIKDTGFQPPTIEEFFEEFCRGEIVDGPYFEHVLGYWKLSLEDPEKVLFLKYEDLKEDTTSYLKRLAEFVGVPFSDEEESGGVVEDIIELCDIENMKEFEVNKKGVINRVVEKKSFFRKGEVGDWKNYLSSTMADRMKKLMDEKFGDSGLMFRLN